MSGVPQSESMQKVERARTLCREGLFEEGIALLREAVSEDAMNAEAHNFLGMALDRTGRGVEALSCFERAAEIRPDFADAVANKADALAGLGRNREAIKSYDRALALDSESGLIWCNRALALLSLAQSEREKASEHVRAATESARRATFLEPDLGEAHVALARASYQTGDHAGAVEAALASFRLGEHPDAKMAFVRAIGKLNRLPGTGPFRAALLKAISEPWDNPRLLAGTVIAVLLNPETDLGKLVRDGASGTMPANEVAGHGKTLADPLLLAAMEAIFLADASMEKFLTSARSALLEATKTGWKPTPEILRFAAALARQCFHNEYVYAITDDEKREALLLCDQLRKELLASIPDSFRTAIAASYFPLSDWVEPEQAKREWAPEIQPLLQQQVIERAALLAMRGTISAITPVSNAISEAVRAQYEENPYPRWNKPSPQTPPPSLETFVKQFLPSAPLQPIPATSPRQILIAGCGTGQQVSVYANIRDAKVLAIDLSLASLSYAKLKNAPLNLHHVEFAQADILELGKLQRQFDCIISTGVLHHMDDPEKGWSVLLSLLKPGGVMHVALYSELARKQVVAAREAIRQRGLTSAPDDIRKFRQEILALPADSPMRILASWPDFYCMSDCRDLLFHVREHRFTIPRIEEFLRRNGLRFLGFEVANSVREQYRRAAPSDPAMLSLPEWYRFEETHPATFTEMYAFWVQKA